MHKFFSSIHQIFQDVLLSHITKSDFMHFVFGYFKANESIFFKSLQELYTYTFENIAQLPSYIEDTIKITVEPYYPSQAALLKYYSKNQIDFKPAKKFLFFLKERPFVKLIESYAPEDYSKKAKELLLNLYKCCIEWNLITNSDFVDINNLDEPQIIEKLNKLFNRLVLSFIDKPAFKCNSSHRLCQHFVPSSSTDYLISQLKEQSVLFLYSIPGMGKTEFCNFLAKNYKNYGFTDLAYVSYGIDLFNTIQKIEFSDRAVLNYEKCRFLQLKDRSSLLIITDMPSDKSVLEETYTKLMNLNITILITVNSASLPSSINPCLFPAFSEEDLEEIFRKHTNLSHSDIQLSFHYLCVAIDFHTLSLVLIAKILYANKLDFNDVLTHKPYAPHLSNTKIIGFKIKYKKKHISFFGHLLNELDYESYFNDSELNCLKLFSLFDGLTIDCNLLIKLIPDFTIDLMDKATNLGILIADSDSKIRMHKIFCELVYLSNDFTNMLASNGKKHKAKRLRFRSLMDNLINIMDTCCVSPYSSSQIQNVALAFFNTIQNHTIRDISNKQQATLSQERITWIKYCHKCILFFQKYGNTVYAQFILDKLCTEYHGLPVNPLFIFEKRFYELTHFWQTSHLSVANARGLFNDMSLYIDTLSAKESDNVIIDNISFLTDLTLDHLHLILEKIISDIKVRSIPLNKTTISYIKHILQTYYATLLLRCTQSITTADKESHIKFINYCLLWTYTPTQRFFKTITLLELATTPWEKLRFLSDIVYWYSDKYLHIESIEYLNYANIYHNKMEQCFKSVRNLPSAEIYSYCIANIYYGICNAKSNRKLLIQILHKIPDLQRQMLQLYDSEFYNKLNNLVSEICNNLFNNDK